MTKQEQGRFDDTERIHLAIQRSQEGLLKQMSGWGFYLQGGDFAQPLFDIATDDPDYQIKQERENLTHPFNRLRSNILTAADIIIAEEVEARQQALTEGEYIPPLRVVDKTQPRFTLLLDGIVATNEDYMPLRKPELRRKIFEKSRKKVNSERELSDAFVGSFVFNLTRGLPGPAIVYALETAADLQEQPIGALLEKYEPVILQAREQLEAINKLPTPAGKSPQYTKYGESYERPGLGLLPTVSPGRSLEYFDDVMERRGFLWDRNTRKYVNMISR